jgi:LysR family glycine cleavage system transcriptional activator
MSFTRAASELCVTNAAVSHQIKQLEEFLGLKLFDRRNNQLLLTGAGENYLPRIREAFSSVQQATAQLLDDPAPPLRIGASPTFGCKWLVPRLDRLFNLHPELRVEVVTEPELLRPGAVDLLIADTPISEGGINSEHLTTTRVFPVCSPVLQPQIRSLPDLFTQTLLHERSAQRLSQQPTWRQWCDGVGLAGVERARGLGLSDSLMSLQAAIDGQGVALAQQLLVEADMTAGRLVKPFELEAPLEVSYYLVYRDHKVLSEDFALLHGWLTDEARDGDAPRAN